MKYLSCVLTISALIFCVDSYARDESGHNERDTRKYNAKRSDSNTHRREIPQHREPHRQDLADNQKYKRDQYRRDEKYSRRGNGHYPNKRIPRKYKRNKSDYFLGGLLLGSLGGHFAYDNRHDYSYSRSKRDGYWRDNYWRDRYGDCFRIEHRKRGKVYVQVPRYKCRY